MVIFYDDGIKGMYTCCEVSKKLILDFVEEVEYNYGNRPALMRLLRNLRDTTESQIGDIPGMMEYRKVLESLTECNIKLQEVMDKEAGKIPMSQASKLILNQLEKQYIEKREELRKIQAKYSWASDKKNPVQQSIADALMYIGFMKLV